ncbi:Williams-Beuren syndrome chromosomal region 27 protein [Plakobranchus ocellatus]|uniref:Williams-Beuren syndrome chromosomal region 27 protein n=1 Tax=Plakobranchus ocellatus TaxID=259542 RepID=A0AAV4CIF7_9GAST|nr:Williams-Beuren syndrome chromosomal region 27 protein [Plakobranchus ocellatus]
MFKRVGQFDQDVGAVWLGRRSCMFRGGAVRSWGGFVRCRDGIFWIWDDMSGCGSGGYILNCMREEYLRTVENFRDKLVPLLQDLEKQGRIQQLEWTIYPRHFNDKDGLRMLYRVL